jgi:SAM-dependent methyltransferase
MQTSTIQRQYDHVIAPHYDRDPHNVIGRSLDLVLAQLERQHCLADSLRVLDLGIGTGTFLKRLVNRVDHFEPHGIDISEKMIEVARKQIPNLDAEVDDAANLEAHFGKVPFDLICSHFVTGFVPIQILAPRIHNRLAVGGFWSFAGGTKAGFPVLQKNSTVEWPRFCLAAECPRSMKSSSIPPTGKKSSMS